jgi:hypothetical protein
MSGHYEQSQPMISPPQILRAAEEGVLSKPDAERLIHWAFDQQFNRLLIPDLKVKPAPEQRKGFNLVTVLYYFGALMMISACGWFLGHKWDHLGPQGICATVLVYMTALISVGVWLRQSGFLVGGGLLITVAVSLTPLVIFTIEKMTGIWPAQDPGSYADFYPMIHASWIGMEVATIVVVLVTLWFVRFSFLTAPMAFSFWFLSMDLAALFYKQNYLDHKLRDVISVVIGLLAMMVGFGVERLMRKRGAPSTEDFAFWPYLFGLTAFWFGLTALEHAESEPRQLIYFFINLGLMALAVRTKRATFMVFGAVGAYIYVGHLAFEVFKNSIFFPFVLAAMGLSIIMLTVFGQKWFRKQRAGEDDQGIKYDPEALPIPPALTAVWQDQQA